MAANFWAQLGMKDPVQAQINQADQMQSGIPPMLQMDPEALAKMDQPTLASAPELMSKVNMPAAAPKVKPQHLSALQAYLPKAGNSGSPAVDSYTDQSNRALDDQKATLAGLNDYIDQIAAKPQGTNWTPLAAYVDNLTGSKLSPVAQAMAPMTADEKDKMLFGLKNQLAEGQAKFSADQLRSLQEQKQIQQWNAHEQELERHNRATESKGGEVGDARMLMAKIRQDDQTSKAVDLVTKDKQLNQYMPRIQGADRILKQIGEVRSGHLVDTPQFLADLSLEHSNLLAGANNAALGKLERTEYQTYAGQMASIIQRITKDPTSINSPEIINHLDKVVASLQQSYRSNFDQRADTLKRHYRYNEDANQQLKDKISEMRGQYGASAGPAEKTQAKPAPHGQVVHQDGKTYTWNGDTYVEQK